MEEKEKKLTPKEEKFCQEYIVSLNATQAAIKAGYSEKTAYSQGHRLLKNVEIQKRIEYLKANLAEACGISAARIIKEHEKIAFVDAGQLRDGWMLLKDFENLTPEQRACIQEVSSRQTKRLSLSSDGEEDSVIVDEYVKIKLYDKQKSLDSLSKMLGYDAPTKIDLNAKVSPMSRQEAADFLKSLEK